ncbi:MAG: hypothetical protein V8R75_10980 [Oscillospiraceae bacterium]
MVEAISVKEPFSHKLKQVLLLLFIKILNLIQIQQNPAWSQQRPYIRDEYP